MLTLAIMFAGLKSYGQVDTPYLDAAPGSCPIPTPLNCGTDGALSPLPGEIYTYEISVTAGSTIHWFVTTDENVITTTGGVTTLTTDREAATGGTYVLSAGTTANGGNASYDDDANTGNILEVAWNYFDPTTTVLLVAYAEDSEGCTDNIEVYRIEPIFNFILDIATLSDAGTVNVPADNDCAFPVQEAIYDGTNLNMDYGDNYIFYIVSAANWVTSWMPTFVAPTSTGGSTVGTIEWAYADQATGAASVWNATTEPVLASHYGGGTSVGADGECIVIRINIDHGNANEITPAGESLTLGVSGMMYNPTSDAHDLSDLNDDGDGNCVTTEVSEATYIIRPRPDINATDPTPFVTKD